MSNLTIYYCPKSGEAFEVDPEIIGWDDDGTAVIDCPIHSSPVADLTRPQWDAVSYRSEHEITIAKPASQGFGGSNAT